MESSITLLCGELVKLPSYGFRGIVTVAGYGVIIPVRDPGRYDDIIMYDSAEQPFLDEILANPADVTPRLIFADWLEERDDPRAEFIRVQCELAELTAEDERAAALRRQERRLFKEGSVNRAVDLPVSVKKVEYRRGFVEHVTMSVRDFLKHRSRVFAAAPIRDVTLTAGGTRMRDLARCEQLQQLETLELRQNRMGDAGIAELTASMYLVNLRNLTVYYNEITEAGARKIAECPQLADIKNLSLFSNEIGNFGARAIAGSPWLTDLKKLSLGSNRIFDPGFADLARSSNMANLTSLALDGNGLTDRSMFDLATSPCLRQLESLAISNDIGPEGMWALAGSDNVRRIHHFDVSGRIDDEGLRAIAEADCFDALRILDVRGNNIGDIGADALAESPRLAQFEKIYLGHNRLTFNGVERLMRSEYRTRKLKLLLRNNAITIEDQRELHQLFGKSALVF